MVVAVPSKSVALIARGAIALPVDPAWEPGLFTVIVLAMPNSIARSLATGSVPGSPRQTGQVRVLGGSPKLRPQPQNIFVRVESWTWISSPMTAS